MNEGKTHYFGDDCEGGHLTDQKAITDETLSPSELEHTRLLCEDGIDFTSSAIRDWFRYYIPKANTLLLNAKENEVKARAWDRLRVVLKAKIDFSSDAKKCAGYHHVLDCMNELEGDS